MVVHFHYMYELGNCHHCLCIFGIVLFRCCTTTTLRHYFMYELLDPETKVQLFLSVVDLCVYFGSKSVGHCTAVLHRGGCK